MKDDGSRPLLSRDAWTVILAVLGFTGGMTGLVITGQRANNTEIAAFRESAKDQSGELRHQFDLLRRDVQIVGNRIDAIVSDQFSRTEMAQWLREMERWVEQLRSSNPTLNLPTTLPQVRK